jgi:pimeloyl-ACP methyl ester carboxylesterase
MNHNIRRGLYLSGIGYGLPIYNWGRPIPGIGMILNQMDFIGNRIAGESIANMIEQYQDEHPGRPVYIVGHSGGGGVAVFAAEALSQGRQIDGLILLSASIHSEYDLTKALKQCRSGLVNFYNENDVGLLAIGTTLTSNVDGRKGPSAGLVGFQRPNNPAPETQQEYSKLFQIPVTYAMAGDDDAHAACTRPRFVSAYVAPWIRSRNWPVGYAVIDETAPLKALLAQAEWPR